MRAQDCGRNIIVSRKRRPLVGLSRAAPSQRVIFACEGRRRAAAAMLVDTTGDGIADSVHVDTTGDGRPDTIVPLGDSR